MIKKLDPNYKIPGLKDTSISDYWAWAYSDILTNTNRSLFAEFLVGKALDAIALPRVEWDCVDIRYHGKTIEVKCSAYIQSWKQNKPSKIKYDIGRRQKVDIACEYIPYHTGEPVRFADCYVFCLYKEKDVDKANVIDISSWEFYVLPTLIINEKFSNQKSISLSVLEKNSNPVPYSKLKACIDSVLGLD